MMRTSVRSGLRRNRPGYELLEQRALLSLGHPGDGFLDITFVSDRYTSAELGTFHSDVERAKAGLLSAEPFHSRVDQIRFHVVDNTSSLGSYHDTTNDRLLIADYSKTVAAVDAAGVTTDFACVIVDDPTYGGSGGGVTVSYNGSDLPIVLLHEFGHTFGGLDDEYSFGTDGPLDGQVHGLSGVSGVGNVYAGEGQAAAWSGLVAADEYFVGGTYNNWLRPSLGSVMRGQGTGPEDSVFNVPSQETLRSKLDYWAGPSADHQAPQVTIAGLSDGDVVSGVVQVASNLVDDRAVMRAQLWVDGVLARNATKAPFTLAWTTGATAAGAHTLEVRAYDASGNMGVSPAVTVQLTAPANLELLGPTGGQTVASSGFDVSVDLWLGGIDRLYVQIDGRTIDSVWWVPFLQGERLTLSPALYGLQLATGAHTLTVIGVRSNLTRTSEVEQGRATGTFTVSGTTQPAIAIQSPQRGSTVKQKVALGVALQGGGTPSSVTYWIDNKKVATVWNAPFSAVWDSRKSKDGSHVLRAVATYATGQSARASSSFVLRNAVDRQAPTITVSAPRNNAKLSAGQQLVVAGKAKDNVGVGSVEVYVDGLRVSISTGAQFRWTTDAASLTLGKHKVRARAIDVSGNAKWSPTLVVKRV